MFLSNLFYQVILLGQNILFSPFQFINKGIFRESVRVIFIPNSYSSFLVFELLLLDLTPSLPLPNPLLRGEGKRKTFIAGRGVNQSLSPKRREVWREVGLWSIYLKIAVL